MTKIDLLRPATAATVFISAGVRERAGYLSRHEKLVSCWCLSFFACGIVAFSGCATEEEFNAAAAKTGETVPGEVNPNAPGASQEQVRTQPGFNF